MIIDWPVLRASATAAAERAYAPYSGLRVGAAGLTAILGATAKRELRVMLLRRTGRGLTTLAPFLAGAVAGGVVNRRVTRSLGEKVSADLRGRR